MKSTIILIISLILICTLNTINFYELFSNNKNNKIYNIFLISDKNHMKGFFAVLKSIKLNTKNYKNIKINIIIYDNKEYYIKEIDKILENKIEYEIKELIQYPEYINELKDNINIVNNDKHVDNILNFSRFFIPLIYSNIDLGIYLDVDMIVLNDITNIYNIYEKNNKKIIKFNKDEVFLDNFNCASVLNRKLNSMNFNKKLNIDGNELGFNAGIYIFNLKKWKEENLTNKCLNIMKDHKKNNLFNGGTQPILNLIYYKKCINIDSRWNKTDLGWKKIHYDELKKNYILHWTGMRKPWKKDGLNKKIWNEYL